MGFWRTLTLYLESIKIMRIKMTILFFNSPCTIALFFKINEAYWRCTCTCSTADAHLDTLGHLVCVNQSQFTTIIRKISIRHWVNYWRYKAITTQATLTNLLYSSTEVYMSVYLFLLMILLEKPSASM